MQRLLGTVTPSQLSLDAYGKAGHSTPATALPNPGLQCSKTNYDHTGDHYSTNEAAGHTFLVKQGFDNRAFLPISVIRAVFAR